MDPDRLVVGRIVKPHGIRGEVAVEVFSDAPERFASGAVVDVGDPPAPRTIAAARPHQGRMLVRFADVDDRNAAEALRGAVLSVPEGEAAPLPEGSYYPHQLEGLEVVDEEGAVLGTWVRAEQTPANDLWVVDAGGREVLVPAVRDVVRAVDLEQKRIVVRPLPGLFD